MIKKIIGLVLILCFAVLNSNIALAKYIYEKPENVEITKEQPEELESFLGEDYKVYKYKIQNNEKETCKLIVNIESAKELYKESAANFRKDMLHRTLPAGIVIGTLEPIDLICQTSFFVFLTAIFPPFAIILRTEILPNVKKQAGEVIDEYMDATFVKPAKSTIMFPCDTVKNIKGTKKARKEFKKYEKYLIDKNTPITLKSGKTFEFYAFANKNTEKIDFKITFDKDKNTYGFNY